MTEEDSFGELWDYTPWELIRVALQMILHNIWGRLKHPKRFLRSVNSLSPEEIKNLREEALSKAKARAAEVLGGSPDDYVIR